MSKIPVIFLAFANDRVDDSAYLRNLPKELHGIREALEEATKAGLCEVVERANATIDSILDVFQDSRYRDRIAIFHYGGHANSTKSIFGFNKRVRQSMSRKGNCWDNAVAESFFKSIKYEELNHNKFESIDHLYKVIKEYMQWYNTKRIHSSIGYDTPLERELKIRNQYNRAT